MNEWCKRRHTSSVCPFVEHWAFLFTSFPLPVYVSALLVSSLQAFILDGRLHFEFSLSSFGMFITPHSNLLLLHHHYRYSVSWLFSSNSSFRFLSIYFVCSFQNVDPCSARNIHERSPKYCCIFNKWQSGKYTVHF